MKRMAIAVILAVALAFAVVILYPMAQMVAFSSR